MIVASNPLQQLFNNLNKNNGNGGNGGFNMSPQQMMGMLQQMMSGQLNPQQAMGQMGGQVKNMSLEEYNKQVLGMATQFNNMYGDRDGSLTSIILNSGLTIGQLQEAINYYKATKGI